MAVKLVDAKYNVFCNPPTLVKSFVMDSASDVSKLPKCDAGSTAMVAAKDGAIYMVNASGEWEEL